MALKLSRAASSAVTARLACRCVPKPRLPLASTSSNRVRSRSSTYRLMNGVPMRAVTFQSMERTSSPGWYSRTSSNDKPVPLKTEWYSPPSRSSTARRARSWRRRICRTTSAGSMSGGRLLSEGAELGRQPLDLLLGLGGLPLRVLALLGEFQVRGERPTVCPCNHQVRPDLEADAQPRA